MTFAQHLQRAVSNRAAKTEVPLHVRRIIENTRQCDPNATREDFNRQVWIHTHCEPQQAIEWVQQALN